MRVEEIPPQSQRHLKESLSPVTDNTLVQWISILVLH